MHPPAAASHLIVHIAYVYLFPRWAAPIDEARKISNNMEKDRKTEKTYFARDSHRAEIMNFIWENASNIQNLKITERGIQ